MWRRCISHTPDHHKKVVAFYLYKDTQIEALPIDRICFTHLNGSYYKSKLHKRQGHQYYKNYREPTLHEFPILHICH
ncbi:hypothetical protein XELAEV_18029758mg [Xenopus laevis]|uniref:Uncharacterized protein n=1 Tax=Xenopus laevis TaxID=8355 RepID=A0A974CUE9_XENLA|nr:hypothetical protein XELAEV_18029758mg [Xenopus laevis]